MPNYITMLLLQITTKAENFIFGSAATHYRGLHRISSNVDELGRYAPGLDSDIAATIKRNDRTIEAYDSNIAEYLTRSPSTREPDPDYHSLGGWLHVYAESLKLRAARCGQIPRVLDLASGPRPRDGHFYRDNGFDVTLSDASARSVERLRESGFDARKINMITDDFGGPWDGISINGGVPHLSDDQLDKVIEKAAGSLSDGGILAYNFKLADSAELIGHQKIFNKGAEKDYYLRWVEALEPWELSHGLYPLMAPAGYSSGGTHRWASKVLVKLYP